jgi:hypothetical protein
VAAASGADTNPTADPQPAALAALAGEHGGVEVTITSAEGDFLARDNDVVPGHEAGSPSTET